MPAALRTTARVPYRPDPSGQRVRKRPNPYALDLSAERREAWERAARRNGLSLAAWIRQVCDAAADRTLGPAVEEVPSHLRPVTFPVDPEDECRHVVFRVRVLPWGGRVCEGCGDLL